MSKRLSSIDAFRGLTVAAMLLVNDPGSWDHVFPWLEHAEWHGCTPPDFIFPFFLFIVGVSIQLALAPKLGAHGAKSLLTRTVLVRAARIFVLGLALHVFAVWTIDGRAFRLFGVLQRIGICFAFAGLLTIYLPSARRQWQLFGAIVLGYWMLLVNTGGYAQHVNLADRIDTALLGRLAYEFDAVTGFAHDPEGILGTLPALATVILGLRAGDWLRSDNIARMSLAGVIFLLLGVASSSLIPLNKQLWTSSFVLVTGGVGLLATSLFHYLIDVRGWPALGRSFGVNAIAAYAGSWIAICVLSKAQAMPVIYDHGLVPALSSMLSDNMISLVYALLFTGAFGLVTYFMYRRGWRITI